METTALVSVMLNPNHSFELKTKRFLDENIQTHFEDFEAVSLVAGITNIPAARKIWSKYFNNKELSERELKFAHQIANQLKKNYTDDILAFLLSCPPKPFSINNAKELFSELDLAKADVENPTLRFLSSTDDKFKKVICRNFNDDKPKYELIDDSKPYLGYTPMCHKFSISFWAEKSEGSVIKRDYDVLVLRNITTGKSLAHISREGTFTPLYNSYIPMPVISLFFRLCNDPKNFIINYGLESGNCSYCDKELKHPTSLKRKYGKKCAFYRGLPW